MLIDVRGARVFGGCGNNRVFWTEAHSKAGKPPLNGGNSIMAGMNGITPRRWIEIGMKTLFEH